MEKPIGWISAPLDARFTTVRLKESNMGNFVCDLMKLHYDADCCIMAAGTVRGDQVYPAGVLKVKVCRSDSFLPTKLNYLALSGQINRDRSGCCR